MSKQLNVFNKINLTVETHDVSTAKHLYQNLSDYVKDVILPQLETKLDSLNISDQHYIADSININIENVSSEKFNETLAQEILKAFDQLLIPVSKNGKKDDHPYNLGATDDFPPESRINSGLDDRFNTFPLSSNSFIELSTPRNLLISFIQFLENGLLPWWRNSSDSHFNEDEIIQAIETDPQLFGNLLAKTAQTSSNWSNRLKLQFSPAFILRLHEILISIQTIKPLPLLKSIAETVRKSSEKLGVSENNFPEASDGNFDISHNAAQPLKKGLQHLNPEPSSNPNKTFQENIPVSTYKSDVIELFFSCLKENRRISDNNNLATYENKILQEIQEKPVSFVSLFIKNLGQQHIQLSKIEHLFSKPFITRLYQLIASVLREFDKDILISSAYNVNNESNSQIQTNTIEELKTAIELRRPETGLNQGRSEPIEILNYRQDEVGSEEKEQFPKNKYASNEQEESTTKEVYIANAGIVLLHPFLLHFFKEFDLVSKNEFKNSSAQMQAVHLLHYLATREEEAFEHSLTFEKYLCGFPLQQPIERFVKITDSMKNESEMLLSACVKHWKALKNTSPDGLREAFIQRKGKLQLMGEIHRLTMEPAAIDILLEQLPWNYSMVKLPWMKQVLHVDWITN